MSVPVVDFELLREYNEFAGETLTTAQGGRYPVIDFRQQIRFRMDEKGAMLKSESCLTVMGIPEPPRALLFNKPFLIALRYKEAQLPYFALWVDNAEVLVPASRGKTDER